MLGSIGLIQRASTVRRSTRVTNGEASPTTFNTQTVFHVRRSAPVLALPGGLDSTPVLNSNHPEIVRGPGITVSTLPGSGPVHQNYAFQGRFDVFSHHQNRSADPLYEAIVLYNPSSTAVTVEVGSSAAATTSQAPYKDNSPDIALDPFNWYGSGPGDVVAGRILRKERAIPDEQLVLAPGETRVVYALKIPVGNEATSQFQFRSDGPVHAAVVMEKSPPTDASVVATLRAGKLVERNPEDKQPTPPGSPGPVIFGRVAGVQVGTKWTARLTNEWNGSYYQVTDTDTSQGFLLVGKRGTTLGTGQDQAAPLIRRYPDSAYAANGNYGVTYELELPLQNIGTMTREARIFLDSPVPVTSVSRAFRGVVAIDSVEPDGSVATRLIHINQRPGTEGRLPLTTAILAPGTSTSILVRLIYPADATPPHVLRIATGPETNPMARFTETLRSWLGI